MLQFHVKYGSGTGMNQGLWPRFYLQIREIGQFTVHNMDFESKIESFQKIVMPQLEELFLIYTSLNEKIADYKEGIASLKYFTVKPNGDTSHDAKLEVEIKRLAKQFFVQSKTILTDLANSEFANDTGFDFGKYSFTSPDKFVKKKTEYAKSTNSKYLPLLIVIEKSNKLFLTELKKLREDYLHSSFVIDEFQIIRKLDEISINEPVLNGMILSEGLKFYYENLLEFIEKIMVYYVGINAEEAMPNVVRLTENEIFDYPRQLYRYTCAIGGIPTSDSYRLCTYD